MSHHWLNVREGIAAREWLAADKAYAMSVVVALPLLGLVLRYEGELYLPPFNEPD